MGEVIQFRSKLCVATGPDMTGASDGFRLTDIEDLFFDVLWKQLHERGEEPPPALQLPRGLKVVHRTAVGRAFRARHVPEDGSLPISDNTVKSRWDRSARRLRKFNIIGFSEPYFWWTGKPVLGKPATRRRFEDRDDPNNNRPGGAA